jgi:hypothetical protein
MKQKKGHVKRERFGKRKQDKEDKREKKMKHAASYMIRFLLSTPPHVSSSHPRVVKTLRL